MLKNFILLSFGISLTCSLAGQEIAIGDENKEIQQTMIDFIGSQQQQIQSKLDSIREFIDPNTGADSEDIGIVKRLNRIEKTIPLSYTSQVKAYIDKYTSDNYRPYMNTLLGLSNHFFPIYEQVFEEMGIPQEIKYLSVVESSLNPHLVSTSGAVGPWQFMYTTAKMYDLDMDTYVDERKDLYAASYAVTKYLKEAHDQFGDWLLAIASYNCGRGCVSRAIKRSGIQAPSFWELAPYLPQETRNYIPKYIAMTYVLSCAAEYGLSAAPTDLDMENKVLLVDNTVDLNSVARALDLTLDQIKKYNPSYKRHVVNGTTEKPKRILLPVTENANDSLLYIALNSPQSATFASSEIVDTENSEVKVKSYLAKRGETLSTISKKFDVSVQNLIAWNNLGTRSQLVGKTLLLEKPVKSSFKRNLHATVAAKRTNNITVYTVRKGDSLDRIANKFTGVTVSKLKADNNLRNSVIQPGMKIKVIKK